MMLDHDESLEILALLSGKESAALAGELTQKKEGRPRNQRHCPSFYTSISCAVV